MRVCYRHVCFCLALQKKADMEDVRSRYISYTSRIAANRQLRVYRGIFDLSSEAQFTFTPVGVQLAFFVGGQEYLLHGIHAPSHIPECINR
jgi:hypothetical protein